MTVESPVTLDLTVDVATQTELQLTPDEQVSYQAYIDTLEAQEREAVISLTQSELQNLKAILNNFDPRENTAGQTIANFIETQKKEGISSSDILAGVEENILTPEILDTFDALSAEVLFGSEGMFRDGDISDMAQDISSSSFSLVLIEAIKNQPEQLVALKTAIENGNIPQIQTIVQSFGGENMAQIGAHLRNMEDDAGNLYRIKGNGEQNKIFMDMQVGSDFFKKVLSGEVTISNIHETLEAQNSEILLSVEIGNIAKLQDLGSFTQEDINALAASVQAPGVPNAPVSTDTPNAPVSTDTPSAEVVVPPLTAPEAEEATNMLAEMKPLGPFLAAILEFLKGITTLHEDTPEVTPTETTGTSGQDTAGETDTDPEVTDTDTDPEEENPSENLISLFTGLQEDFPVDKENVIQELSGNPELSRNMLSALESISADETIEVSFSHLFGNDRIDGIGLDVFRIFENAELFNTLPEGTSEAQKILLLVKEYAQYRNSPGVRDKTENRTNWLTYGETRKDQGWTRDTSGTEERR